MENFVMVSVIVESIWYPSEDSLSPTNVTGLQLNLHYSFLRVMCLSSYHCRICSTCNMVDVQSLILVINGNVIHHLAEPRQPFKGFNHSSL